MYLCLLFVISNSSKLGLRVSNYKDNNNRYNYASYSYNKSNHTGKILPGDDDEIHKNLQRLHWIKIIHQLSKTFFSQAGQ